MCGIVLFSLIIVLLVAVRVVLVVGTYCTNIVSATPVCTSPDL
jgi:hypothetical protein